MKPRILFSLTCALLLVFLLTQSTASAQGPRGTALGNGFTYQGTLSKDGTPVEGTCSFDFSLWDAASPGLQIGPTRTQSLLVREGRFTSTPLDFGSTAFNGEARFLQIRVTCAPDAPVTLSPLQTLTASPYALYAKTAGNVSGAFTGDVTGAQASTTVARLQGRNMSSTAPTSGQVLQWNGSAWAPANVSAGSGWSLTGNAGTTPPTQFLGTTDNNYFTLKVNGQTGWRLAPSGTDTPNVIGGSDANWVTTGVKGATIGGGGVATYANRVTDDYGTVAGGDSNQAGDNAGTTSDRRYATVGGGYSNIAGGAGATIGGGGFNGTSHTGNTAFGPASTIGGGYGNVIPPAAAYATIGGGSGNTAIGELATVAGGGGNTAFGAGATMGGGGYDGTSSWGNYAAGPASTIAGGMGNTTSTTGSHAVVGGGYHNTANNIDAAVGGGIGNVANGDRATIGGGYYNTASNNAATVPGGANNQASGPYSFAAGAQANATHAGSFVWSSGARTDSYGDNTFTVRAHGGARFYSGPGTGTGAVLYSGGGGFSSLSDRASKDNLATVNTRDILARLAAIPVDTWNYKTQDPTIRHIGPMAQDFYAAFQVGEEDTHIGTLDADGVALAAIQGLNEIVKEKDAEIQALKSKNSEQQARLDAFEARLSALERQGGGTASSATGLADRGLVVGGFLVAAVAVARKRRGNH